MKVLWTCGLFLFVINSLLEAQTRWHYSASVDEITDDHREIAWVRGESESPELDHTFGRPQLVLRCDSDLGRNQDLWVETEHRFLNSNGSIPAIVRVDENKPIEIEFRSGTEGTAGFFPKGRWPELKELIPQMKAGAVLRVRLRDFRGTSHDFLFSLRGFTEAISQLGCFAEIGRAVESSSVWGETYYGEPTVWLRSEDNSAGTIRWSCHPEKEIVQLFLGESLPTDNASILTEFDGTEWSKTAWEQPFGKQSRLIDGHYGRFVSTLVSSSRLTLGYFDGEVLLQTLVFDLAGLDPAMEAAGCR